MKVSTCSKRPVLEPCSLESADYQIDPYIGCEHYCYYCYVLGQAETDWTEEILIHEDMTGRVRETLSGIPPQRIYMGWHTDPYQPCEAEYRQTRQVLELLLEMGFSAGILTKSNLVLRDLDVFQAMNDANVSVSVAFADNAIRRQFESHTMDTESRIDALRGFKKAGVRTSALVCPVIPFITDAIALVEMLAPHTDKIWIYGLSILNRSDQNWRNVEGILERDFPDMKDRIETVIFSKDHFYWEKLRQDLISLQKDRNLNLSIHV